MRNNNPFDDPTPLPHDIQKPRGGTLNREDDLKPYHKRSNVESTFSAIKRKFGDAVRSETDVAIRNEVLAKVPCHNLVVVVHEMHELGIDPAGFGVGPKAESRIIRFPGA